MNGIKYYRNSREKQLPPVEWKSYLHLVSMGKAGRSIDIIWINNKNAEETRWINTNTIGKNM